MRGSDEVEKVGEYKMSEIRGERERERGREGGREGEREGEGDM